MPVVSAYIRFIAHSVVGFKSGRLNLATFTGLILDLSNVIVERNIVTEAVLKPKPRHVGTRGPEVPKAVAEEAQATLSAYFSIFAQYFKTVVESRHRNAGPVPGEAMVIVRWPQATS